MSRTQSGTMSIVLDIISEYELDGVRENEACLTHLQINIHVESLTACKKMWLH